MKRTSLAVMATTLVWLSASALAQEPGIVNWGKLVGGNAANAAACGASGKQVEAYKAKQKQTGQALYGQASSYASDFETGYAQGLANMTKAHKAGKAKPDAEICTQLLQDAR